MSGRRKAGGRRLRAQGSGLRTGGAELRLKGTEKRVLNEADWHEVCVNIFIIH
jgi:hypothetical protein